MPKGKALNPCPGSYETVEVTDFDALDEDGTLWLPCPVCERGLKPRNQSSTVGLDGTHFWGVLPCHNGKKAN